MSVKNFTEEFKQAYFCMLGTKLGSQSELCCFIDEPYISPDGLQRLWQMDEREQ
ncbi:putative phage integrase domain protein [Yersinia ruckeri ATCC 29473]|uniref:Uncharacterized protein n=1 Tax=Yersinia ruckeri TaxID=29486 RepID=A0A0A8VGB0_YERRU|nr:putative phage integrase domain protein [Yersinia ruckeri ATCC 29473]QTD76506.1 Uncharacterized protein YR821_1582 [Yersinia ruckeri]CEK27408.1 hypothetical protein CSF007_8270 [Yersinia ruckeri]CNI32060.1 Uncharacterised protein [Yersinia ruckeri]SUP97341.1 Uncharacterised protein [Yersinia ruckeri]